MGDAFFGYGKHHAVAKTQLLLSQRADLRDVDDVAAVTIGKQRRGQLSGHLIQADAHALLLLGAKGQNGDKGRMQLRCRAPPSNG